MTMRSRLRLPRVAKIAAVALTSAALTVTLAGPVEAAPHHRADLPSRIELPDGFQPEGITVGRGGVAYLGSRTDGDIYAVDLKNGKGGVISQGPGAGSPSVGLKYGRNRLYVAGGNTGTGRVVDARTGALLASYTFTTKPSFVNDVVLTPKAAWFTDSQQPQLYRVSRTRDAEKARVRTVRLKGDWEQDPDAFNANGIVRSPDKRALLVVQSGTGFLFRVNPRTGVARRVDLGDALLTNGDGLLLRGRTLYAVQNRDNKIAVVELNRRGTRGTLVDTLTADDLPAGTSFSVPTTVAAYRGSLYLPNARFGVENADTTAEYWITRIEP
jgi:sugar lactone lactonase YvrE